MKRPPQRHRFEFDRRGCAEVLPVFGSPRAGISGDQSRSEHYIARQARLFATADPCLHDPLMQGAQPILTAIEDLAAQRHMFYIMNEHHSDGMFSGFSLRLVCCLAHVNFTFFGVDGYSKQGVD